MASWKSLWLEETGKKIFCWQINILELASTDTEPEEAEGQIWYARISSIWGRDLEDGKIPFLSLPHQKKIGEGDEKKATGIAKVILNIEEIQ